MGRFDDLLAQLRNPGEDGLPDNFDVDLEQAYQDDVTTRDAKIQGLSTARETDTKEISRLKSMNFDLMSAQPSNDDEGRNKNLNQDGDRPRGIAALFG